MEIKPKKDRVFLEKIKKSNLLTSSSNQEFDFEDYKFKVIAIGDSVVDRDLVGQTIIKQKQTGLNVELEGKEIIVIREDDILGA